MRKHIHAIATMDTKGPELCFVARQIRAAGVEAITVDVGTGSAPLVPPNIPREQVAACHPRGARHVLGQTDRGQAVTAMSEALVEFLALEHRAGRLWGVIGLGGSGGTALLTPALRNLPIGLPRLLVSTIASGNTSWLGCSDITLMPSVVDVAGLNSVSTRILANAAHAIAGMVAHPVPPAPPHPAVGLTMFGVTTPCVNEVRRALEAQEFDPLVFHATGTGGQAMEKLVESGLIQGVLDITTTEVADEVVGGVFPAGPERFSRILKAEVPYVLSLGALDMVNFGPRDTVPEHFRNRRLHVHNAQVTLMRTTPEENIACARWMAERLNRSTTPLSLLIPEQGVSALDAPGQPFHDPDADRALFAELEARLQQTPKRRILRFPLHINDPIFARALTDEFLRVRQEEIG
jgi:uncharacterized protein (UPF0261 family)